MTVQVGLVLVSHSGNLAQGLTEIAEQMAPDVQILPAGGTDDDRIGTSFKRIEQMIAKVLAEGTAVLVLTDLGSAAMTAEAVVEMMDGNVLVAHAPFVEGAVAAAVAAQSGGDVQAVHEAALEAIDSFARPQRSAAELESGTGAAQTQSEETTSPRTDTVGEPMTTSTLTLKNTLGLHARPAALVARIAGQYDAVVTVNGIDAASVLALMGLALPGGAEVVINAVGPQAYAVMHALIPEFEAGFGEE